MKKALIFALFCFFAPHAYANDIQNREDLSFLLYIKAPKEQTLAASMQGMRLGCMATAKADADRAACKSLADKLYELMAAAKQELVYDGIIGLWLTPKEHERLKAVIGEKIAQIGLVRAQLFSRFPYVQVYIFSGTRSVI